MYLLLLLLFTIYFLENGNDRCFFLYAHSEDLCTSVIGLSDTVVGVLGGGQLGRMLCQAASKMGVKVAVLDPMENCPASAIAHRHVVGSFRDTNAVQKFAKEYN